MNRRLFTYPPPSLFTAHSAKIDKNDAFHRLFPDPYASLKEKNLETGTSQSLFWCYPVM